MKEDITSVVPTDIWSIIIEYLGKMARSKLRYVSTRFNFIEKISKDHNVYWSQSHKIPDNKYVYSGEIIPNVTHMYLTDLPYSWPDKLVYLELNIYMPDLVLQLPPNLKFIKLLGMIDDVIFSDEIEIVDIKLCQIKQEIKLPKTISHLSIRYPQLNLVPTSVHFLVIANITMSGDIGYNVCNCDLSHLYNVTELIISDTKLISKYPPNVNKLYVHNLYNISGVPKINLILSYNITITNNSYVGSKSIPLWPDLNNMQIYDTIERSYYKFQNT